MGVTAKQPEGSDVDSFVTFQRNLNNVFAYDLVPSPSVIVAALKAARRVHDFPTAVRIFEGTRVCSHPPLASIFPRVSGANHAQSLPFEFVPAGVKAKVENKHQYKEYLDELKEHRDELGVPLQEEMYPEAR